MANDDTLMFVYGTLKRGLTNHTRCLSLAEQRGGATFVAEATTIERIVWGGVSSSTFILEVLFVIYCNLIVVDLLILIHWSTTCLIAY